LVMGRQKTFVATIEPSLIQECCYFPRGIQCYQEEWTYGVQG
jgi:hypothetical protein